jgi:hypothetical protein
MDPDFLGRREQEEENNSKNNFIGKKWKANMKAKQQGRKDKEPTLQKKELSDFVSSFLCKIGFFSFHRPLLCAFRVCLPF